MKQLKKTILTLVALLAVTTGAWADEQYPIVYDFEAAANAGENPGNKNGSSANGQAFYGWEKSDRTDSKRQDYKGYEYAEGSKLPKVCHVWRRSDRINGNVAGNGGLKCPSDKEMAVDGLTEGLTVTIIYDATNATNKEIVWAIGDGSSEGGPGEVRAKATINGVEAVPGQTTIKSGDMITVTKVTPAENGSGYIVFAVKKDMVIKQIIVDVAPAGTAVDIAWDKTTKTGTFTQPAGNVTVSVEYFPQAALTEAPTAINDVPATTDGAIVKVGTVANIGSTTTAQGTVMYYVSQTALDDDALLALDADKWKADVPTAESLAQGTAHVYYYVRGNDSDTDEENFSDGDINALNVTIAAEPTYAVTFADGVNPEPPAEPEWTASPNTGVTKGQTVTVTYTGTRKVIGVKAEKKAVGLTYPVALSAVTADYLGSVVTSDGNVYPAKTDVPAGKTAVGILGMVTSTGHGLILALKDAAQQNWNTINGWTSETTYAGTTLKLLPDDDARGNLSSYETLGETTVSDWAVAQKSDYEAIFTNFGTTAGDQDGMTYDGNVNAYITTGVGGTEMSITYWSATGYNDSKAWNFDSNSWNYPNKTKSYNVRPVLGF